MKLSNRIKITVLLFGIGLIMIGYSIGYGEAKNQDLQEIRKLKCTEN